MMRPIRSAGHATSAAMSRWATTLEAAADAADRHQAMIAELRTEVPIASPGAYNYTDRARVLEQEGASDPVHDDEPYDPETKAAVERLFGRKL